MIRLGRIRRDPTISGNETLPESAVPHDARLHGRSGLISITGTNRIISERNGPTNRVKPLSTTQIRPKPSLSPQMMLTQVVNHKSYQCNLIRRPNPGLTRNPKPFMITQGEINSLHIHTTLPVDTIPNHLKRRTNVFAPSGATASILSNYQQIHLRINVTQNQINQGTGL
ncbi:unnamed protein product [Rotaria socialis]